MGIVTVIRAGPSTVTEGNNVQTSVNLTTTSSEVPSTSDPKSLTHDDSSVNARTILPKPISDGDKEEKTSLVPQVPFTTTQSHFVTPSETIMTLLDSGASDHCFTDHDKFESYEELSPPRTGQSAGKELTLKLEGLERQGSWQMLKGTY
jgi:hypothetical protein